MTVTNCVKEIIINDQFDPNQNYYSSDLKKSYTKAVHRYSVSPTNHFIGKIKRFIARQLNAFCGLILKRKDSFDKLTILKGIESAYLFLTREEKFKYFPKFDTALKTALVVFYKNEEERARISEENSLTIEIPGEMKKAGKRIRL